MKSAGLLALIVGLLLAPPWWWVFSMASAFGGGVEFPPTLGDFAFAPRIYGVIYGTPVFLIVLFAVSWAANGFLKNKRTHASNR
jgi:hypothetical protein